MVWLVSVRVSVSKAVIPAAGLGTRFLPATKAQPKEMLPVVDKPVIQYVVEEAVASGIDDILVVTGRGKRSIEAHFDKSYELEEELLRRGKGELLEEVRGVSCCMRSGMWGMSRLRCCWVIRFFGGRSRVRSG